VKIPEGGPKTPVIRIRPFLMPQEPPQRVHLMQSSGWPNNTPRRIVGNIFAPWPENRELLR